MAEVAERMKALAQDSPNLTRSLEILGISGEARAAVLDCLEALPDELGEFLRYIKEESLFRDFPNVRTVPPSYFPVQFQYLLQRLGHDVHFRLSEGANKAILRQILTSFFDKVPLMEVLTHFFPENRQESIFHYPGNEKPLDVVKALLDEKGAIYYKDCSSADVAGSGKGVWKITKVNDDKCRLVHNSGKDFEMSWERICDLNKRYFYFSDKFIVEEAIDIPRIAFNQSWELRVISPFDDCDYSKVSAMDAEMNTISLDLGGNAAYSKDTLRSVFRSRYKEGELSDSVVRERVEVFIRAAHELANSCKQKFDAMAIELAKILFPAGVFKSKYKYEDLMAELFSSTFLVCDITGMWTEDGDLRPMLIESQRAGYVSYYSAIEYTGNILDEYSRLRNKLIAAVN